jgi:O-antigen/teichoic acid export membrane protein
MKSQIGKTIARNFSIMLGANAVTWISSFVLLLFLPRYLGSEDYGRLYLALSIKMMLNLLIDFGGNYLITKEVARSEKVGSKILNSFLMLRILLWVVALGILILMTHLLGYSDQVNFLLMIMAITMLWEAGLKGFTAYFQGIERMEYPSLGLIVERLFVAAVAIVVLLMGGTSIEVAAVMTGGVLLHLIVVFWYSRKFVTLSFNLDGKMFSLLQSGLPYFLFSLFSVIYYRIDAVMLSSMTSESVTGWYGGAYRFFDMVMLLPMIYKTVIFPVFAKLWKDEDGVLQDTISRSLKLILMLGIPTAILIFAFARNIIDLFMGLEEYGPAVVVLQIFALSIPVIYVDLIIGSVILGAANKQKGWAFVGFLAIFLNIGVNYLLIPMTQTAYLNGGIGAAVATLITELFMFVSALYLLPSGYLTKFRFSYLGKPMLAGATMGAMIWGMFYLHFYWILSAILSGIIYLVGLWYYRSFDAEEQHVIRNALSLEKIKVMLSGQKVSL